MEKVEFGVKVRRLREQNGLTREAFCEDEAELTVRQLTRIEAGNSKPTLTKMEFIASRLGLTLFQLMPDYVKPPQEYTNLKYQVLRTPTYGNKEKIEERDESLNKIYNEFYDTLPEEEKLVIDTLRSITDVYAERNAKFGEYILDDYFYQISKKNTYTANDLVIIQLYLLSLGDIENSKSFDKMEFNHIIEILLSQAADFKLDELFVLRDILLTAVGVGTELNYHIWTQKLFLALDELMIRVHDFQKKPILNMLMWQYFLCVEKDIENAEKMYQEALVFAQITKQDYLYDKLTEQWEQDIKD